MIISTILNALVSVLETVFGFINLPDAPEALTNVIDKALGYMEAAMSLVAFFLPLDFIRVCIPILILLINFEEVYDITLYVLRKIPFLGIK